MGEKGPVSRKEWLAAAGLALLALAVRAAYVLNVDIAPFNDPAQWDRARLAILHGLPYSAAWTPLYPAVLALVTKLTWESYTVLYMANGVISAATGLVVFLIAREAFGRRTALLSMLFWALYVDLTWYSAVLMAETLGILVFAVFIYGVMRGWHPLASGFLLGMACMTKGLFLIAVPAAVFWYWYLYRGGPWLRKTALMQGALFVTLLPWNIRNTMFYKEVVPLEPTLWATVFDGHNPYATGGVDYAFLGHEYGKFYTDPSITPLERERICRDKSIEFILNNPLREIPLTLRKLSKQLSFVTSFVLYREPYPARKALFALSLLQNMVVFPLAALSLIFLWRDRNVAGFAAIIAAFVGIFVTLFTAEVRKRMPLMPVLLPLAAHGALLLPGLLERARRGALGEDGGKFKAALWTTALLFLNFFWQFATRYKDVLQRFQ